MKDILSFHNWKQTQTNKGVVMSNDELYTAYGNYCNKFFHKQRETK